MSEHRITVILDTNIFVAAHWSPRSASARIIRACMDGTIQAQYSLQTRRETMRILHKAHISAAFIASLERFWDAAQAVAGVEADVRVDDPDDQKFIEAALGGETDYLVTNDDHLLRIRYIGRTEILPPASLARVLGV